MTNTINEIEENYPMLNEYEIAINFARFQEDIEKYKKVITKLKRKEIEFELINFAVGVRHLQEKEEIYFEMMKELFSIQDEIRKSELLEELSYMVYNRRGIQQALFEYEMKVTEEHKNK